MDRRLWHRRGAAFWRGGLPRSGRSQDSSSILSQSIAVPTADELLQPRQWERLGVTLPRASLSVCVGPGRVPALGVRLRLRHFVRATRCVCVTRGIRYISGQGAYDRLSSERVTCSMGTCT